MKHEILNETFQIKQNIIEETTKANEEGITHSNKPSKLDVQRNKWRGHNRNAICWVFLC
jgi:hypothetical protein